MNRNRIDCFALHASHVFSTPRCNTATQNHKKAHERGSADALYFSARIRLFFQPTRKESSGHAEDTFFGAISASGFESLKARITYVAAQVVVPKEYMPCSNSGVQGAVHRVILRGCKEGRNGKMKKRKKGYKLTLVSTCDSPPPFPLYSPEAS